MSHEAANPNNADFSDLQPYIFATRNERATPEKQVRLLERWVEERNRLHAVTRAHPEVLNELQFQRIRTIVDKARMTHPFYRELYRSAGYSVGDLRTWDDYFNLPTVSKTQIIDAYAAFEEAAQSDSGYYASRTSGSSGAVLTILQDDTTTASGVLFYMRHYEVMLGRRREPYEWVYRIYLSPPRFPSLTGKYPIFTLSQDCPPDLAIQHIRFMRPPILKAFPSYLERMIGQGPRLTDLGVEAICTHSEFSSHSDRARYAEVFGAPVFDEYSSEELYLIATQCLYRNYHLIEDNVRVDIEVTRGMNYGDLIATSLTNDCMPFIRYRQGDIAEITPERERCACGTTFRILNVIHGRSDAVLITSDGSMIPSDRLMGIYNDTLLLDNSGLAEFRIYQLRPGRVILVIRPDRLLNHEIVKKFVTGLRALYMPSDLDISVFTTPTMPSLSSMKRRLIVSDPTFLPEVGMKRCPVEAC